MIVGGKSSNRRFDRVFDLESIIEKQVRNGDVEGALASLRGALRVNPQDACCRYLQGVLLHSVGMANEALEDLESALYFAKKPELKSRIRTAIVAIEQEQVELIRVLVAEDKYFRLEFVMNPVEAARKRGFKLCRATENALPFLVVQMMSESQPCDAGQC